MYARKSVYPENVVDIKSIDIRDKTFLTTSNDPQITLNIEETVVNNVEIRFSKK